MDEKKLHYKYATKEDRLNAWREQRVIYDEWRKTAEGRDWVEKKSEAQLGLCFTCLTPLKPPIHVDHIFPLYLGGTNAKANLCIMHADCNIRKGVQVYMTYKEACRRRQLLNDLRRGIEIYRRLKVNPDQTLGKKNLKRLQLAKQYFSDDKLNNMVIDGYKKKKHEERLAKRRMLNKTNKDKLRSTNP